MTTRVTSDLHLAALLRSLGATVVSVTPGPDEKGEVTLDVSRVTEARIRDEAAVLTEQLSRMPAQPDLEQVRHLTRNTFLNVLFQEHSELRKLVLKLKAGGRR